MLVSIILKMTLFLAGACVISFLFVSNLSAEPKPKVRRFPKVETPDTQEIPDTPEDK